MDEKPSDMDKGGVSAPELMEVHVLERERVPGLMGREKTGIASTRNKMSDG
jgi:hypothetical protein